MIGKDSADMMNATLQSGGTVFMSLSSTYMVDNPYYRCVDVTCVSLHVNYILQCVCSHMRLLRCGNVVEMCRNSVLMGLDV